MDEENEDKEIAEILANQSVSRHLVHHAESESLFEVFTDLEMQSCLENGADDVSGIQEFEDEFKEQQNKVFVEALKASGVTPLEIAREFTTSLSTAKRWLSGTNLPHPCIRKYVFEFLEKRKQLRLN